MEITIAQRSCVSVPVQLRSILAEEIRDGAYDTTGRLPSERALAERFAVSRTSIRESLDALVRNGLLVRVVGKGTFIASSVRQETPPSSETSGHLAFLIGENIYQFVQPGYSRVLIGAEQTCRQLGYRLLFHSVGEEEADPKLGLPQGEPGGVQGCLVAGGLHTKTLRRLLDWNVPVVLTDLIVEDGNTGTVGADYASGTRQAMEHLAGLGHTQIGFIGFPNSEKYQAYWQTLEQLDLAYEGRFVHFLQLPDVAPGIVAGFQAVQSLIKNRALPGAILATNDLVAMGAIEALKVAGVNVPEQVSIIGYDDLGQEMRPPLTTIRSFPEEVGRIAARVLIDRLAERTTQNRIAVPTELLIRGTTAAASATFREAGAAL